MKTEQGKPKDNIKDTNPEDKPLTIDSNQQQEANQQKEDSTTGGKRQDTPHHPTTHMIMTTTPNQDTDTHPEKETTHP